MTAKNSISPKPQYHLGINLGHDRSAALVLEGQIVVAIDQERLDRQKHSIGFMHQSMGDNSQIQLPHEAIQYCLQKENLQWEDLASITANMPGVDHSTSILKKALPTSVHGKIKTIHSHHLSHAYSAYWPSGFEEAIILSVDGAGTAKDGWTESYSLYVGKGNKIKQLYSGKVPSHLAELGTLGSMYEFICKKAGFVTQISESLQLPESGKLMGLAAFGKPQPNWSNWIRTIPGSYEIRVNSYDIALETEVLRKLHDQEDVKKNYLKPYIVDLSFKVQQELEKALLHLIKTAVDETGIKKVCLAGGVALNSVANYRLLRDLELEEIFVFPAAGDNGIAAGNALWAYDNFDNGKKRVPLVSASLGIQYSQEHIQSALDKFEDEIEFKQISDDDAINLCAEKMAQGCIVARFEGGSEFGPRALGNRSIMADPTFEKMKDVINYRVKFRESFRPFAPVVPVENIEEIFDLKVSSPFMLIVSDIKQKYQDQLPAITHKDGTGRVQTVDKENNAFFHALTLRLQKFRKGPAVLLNTSYNVAGQPIVETPEEAIATFLNTDIDFLCIENYWVQKKTVAPKDYQAHLEFLPDPIIPIGLEETDAKHLELVKLLDDAIFNDGNGGGIWTRNELLQFSAKYGRYKSYSDITNIGFTDHFKSVIDNKAVIFLNPLGNSVIKSVFNNREISLDFKALKLHCFVLYGGELEKLRIDLNLSIRELYWELLKIKDELNLLGIKRELTFKENPITPSPIDYHQDVFGAFSSAEFNIEKHLVPLYSILKETNYTARQICKCLGIEDLQNILPTYLAYYDRFILAETPLHQLIKLFLIRGRVSVYQAISLFGEVLFETLVAIGMLVVEDGMVFSRVAVFSVDGFFIATDHRFLFLKQDVMKEGPVMYIGSDSLGLIQTAPRYHSKSTLDLCTGSGVQAIIASRYSDTVIAVDINPRAVRFARFNAMLNGIHNMDVRLGSLYDGLDNCHFDTILANPPFVPSPNNETKFRDGGSSGEDVLKSIIEGASNKLNTDGQLFIVTDLVRVDDYQKKLSTWWNNEKADILLLKTADRNEILFSVPHCHHPFGQKYEDYKAELFKWVENFRSENLLAVNFGYILIKKCNQKGSYFCKTINNPNSPIYDETRSYFDTKSMLNRQYNGGMKLHIDSDLKVKTVSSFSGEVEQTDYFLTSESNPYFCEYKISKSLYDLLHRIAERPGLIVQYSSNPVLLNLIYRGIIKIEKTDSFMEETHKFENLLNGFVVPEILNKKTKVEPIEIIEFETKTTPTCLSAYLRQ